jgi:hypothetical protein
MTEQFIKELSYCGQHVHYGGGIPGFLKDCERCEANYVVLTHPLVKRLLMRILEPIRELIVSRQYAETLWEMKKLLGPRVGSTKPN